jgi:photosystem II stability/assembly factor-like uncharacterized protein
LSLTGRRCAREDRAQAFAAGAGVLADRVCIFAATGQDVMRVALDGARAGQPEMLLQGVGAHCVAVDPHDPGRVYVGTLDDGLFASEDGGLSWRPDERGLEERRVMSLAVSASHRESGVSVLYAGTEPSNLYRSEDGGRTFTRLPALRELPSKPTWSFPPRPWTHHVRTIATHSSDPDWLAVGIELGGVMRSHDAGASWIDHNLQAHSDAHQLLTHPLAPDRLYEAAGQGIARSDDLGDSWQRIEEGLDRRYAWAQALDPADPDLWYVAVSTSPFAAHGKGDGQARLYRTRGNGFTPIDCWAPTPELRRMPYALAALPHQSGHLLVALRGGSLLLTPDAGESWQHLPIHLPDAIDLATA